MIRWHVSRCYSLNVARKRNGDVPKRTEYGEVAGFDTEDDARAFSNRSRATTAWAPHGAYDLDVSEPWRVETTNPR